MTFYVFCIFMMLRDPAEQKEVPTKCFKGCWRSCWLLTVLLEKWGLSLYCHEGIGVRQHGHLGGSPQPHTTDLNSYLREISLYQNTLNQHLRADNVQKPSASWCEQPEMESIFSWTEHRAINLQDILGVLSVCATFSPVKWLGWVSGVVGEPLTDESVG